MNLKISQEKLNFLEDTIFEGLDIFESDWKTPFQIRYGRIEFLTPGNRRGVIGFYDPEYSYNYISVNDDKFYDLLKSYVPRQVYDLIKENLIKRIFKVYTDRYPSIYKKEVKDVSFVDGNYNKI